jgi:hypothetical protein
MIDRLHKCLELMDSPVPGERIAAFNVACPMMAQQGLRFVDLYDTSMGRGGYAAHLETENRELGACNTGLGNEVSRLTAENSKLREEIARLRAPAQVAPKPAPQPPLVLTLPKATANDFNITLGYIVAAIVIVIFVTVVIS